MPRPMGHLRILMSSRVLLDLEEADKVFRDEGVAGYTDYMLCHGKYEKDKDPVLKCRRLGKGPLFDFALALHNLNRNSKTPLVEVGVSAKDEVDTAFVLYKNLSCSGLSFALEYRTTTAGGPVTEKVHNAFKTDLFLTRSEADAQIAIDLGIAAAVMNFPSRGTYDYDHQSFPLHIVVDGDAVAFGDSAEVRFREAVDSGIPYEEALLKYKNGEFTDADDPVEPGPFTPVLAKISQMNASLPKDKAPFILSLLTARGGPASERALATVVEYGIKLNGDSGWMGGSDKGTWLEAYRPHVFFDDQQTHLERGAEFCPTGRVPYKTGSPMFEYLARKKAEAAARNAATFTEAARPDTTAIPEAAQDNAPQASRRRASKGGPKAAP